MGIMSIYNDKYEDCEKMMINDKIIKMILIVAFMINKCCDSDYLDDNLHNNLRLRWHNYEYSRL